VITEAAWQEPRWQALAERAGTVAVVPPALMTGLSALESPAPLGFVVPWNGAEALTPGVPSIVLDRLQDPGNVGTILRCASAFGFTQVIAIKGTAALWSPKVLRAGMGAHFKLRLVEAASHDDLDALALPLVATSSHAGASLPEVQLPWPCAWVLGHEGQGVATTLLERCALTLRIPQPGGEESLNVASAAAVCLYESMRQRIGEAPRRG
jgi:TrmH family RNA methyltransferase